MYPETMTAREIEAVANAIETGIFEAIDAREDSKRDSDPLLEDRSEGKRIADGFAMLAALER